MSEPVSGRLAGCFFARGGSLEARRHGNVAAPTPFPLFLARPVSADAFCDGGFSSHLAPERSLRLTVDLSPFTLHPSSVPLHNHFLMAIVSNAHNSSSTPAPGPGQAKRQRPDDVTPYGAKRRVLSWVLGTSRREREKLKVRDAYEESAEKTMKDVERRRDERRRTGAGWVGGSELTRERAVLGPSTSANVDEESRSPLPTGQLIFSLCSRLLRPVANFDSTPTAAISQHPALLATAVESRFLPSADDLRSRVARASLENGLEGVSPGVGQFLNAALEVRVLESPSPPPPTSNADSCRFWCILLQDQLKALITSHLHLHRSNHFNLTSSSSSSSQPALSYTASAPASPTSTASTLPPQTPPASFSQSALESLLTIAPATILQQGRVARAVHEGVLDDEGFQQLWAEAAAERRKVAGIDEKWSATGRPVQREDEAEDADEDGKAKGKNKRCVCSCSLDLRFLAQLWG